VPLVSKPLAFACRAERLARAAAGPDFLLNGPARLLKRVTPDSDAGEEVGLGVAAKVRWYNVFNATAIKVSLLDKVVAS
jgi:hypothetical protein